MAIYISSIRSLTRLPIISPIPGKAIWVKKCSGHVPPKTHNLLHILKNAAVSVPEDVEQKIVIINTFNIEGRYPSDIKALQRRCTKAFTSDMLNDIEQLTQWLYEMT